MTPEILQEFDRKSVEFIKKATIISIILFTLVFSTAFAELTKQDLEEIKSIVKEEVGEVREEVTAVEGRLNKRIDDLRADLKGDINLLAWAIGILALFVLGTLVLPQFLGRAKKEEA